MAILQNDEAERVRLTAPVIVRTASGPHSVQALIDSGAEANFISQLWVKELGLQEAQTSIRMAKGVNGEPVKIYGVHTVMLTVRDSREDTPEAEHSFFAADIPDHSLILGYPWLYRHNPKIDWQTGEWTHTPTRPDIEIVPSKEFAADLEQGAQAYLVTLKQDSIGFLGAVGQEPPETQIPPEAMRYAHVFSAKEAGKLPDYYRMEHGIDLVEGGQPPYGPLYNLSQRELEVLQDYLADATKKGWIRRSTSPAGAPVLFVPKKGGTGLRLCVDYRGLNKLTIKNRHALLLISKTLDRLYKAAVFTKLDLKDAYYRIRIKKGDEWKTAFYTWYSYYKYLVILFGLVNVLVTF